MRTDRFMLATWFLVFFWCVAGGHALASQVNDIEMLILRYKDPSYQTGNRAIDALGPDTVKSRLATEAIRLSTFLRVPSKADHRNSQAVDLLFKMGKAASSTLPTLTALLGTSSTSEFNTSPSFCDLSKLIGVIGPEAKGSGAALGKGLTRAQSQNKQGVCHMCGCALRAIALLKGSAAEEARPYLEQYMKEGESLSTYHGDLPGALQATSMQGAESVVVSRLKSEGTLPDEKILLIKQMTSSLSKMKKVDRDALYMFLNSQLLNQYTPMRAEAVAALSLWGKSSFGMLRNALKDSDVRVRMAALNGLSRLGPSAEPSTSDLIAHLDPILGTALEASRALVAIGPGASSRIRAAVPKAEPWRSYYLAVADAAENKDSKSLLSILRRHFLIVKSSWNTGEKDREEALLIKTIQTGKGMGYLPEDNRLSLEYRMFEYKSPESSSFLSAGKEKIFKVSGSIWNHLKGAKAGDKVQLFLSPQLSVSPSYGLANDLHQQVDIRYKPAFYEVSVKAVCKPVFWTLWRNVGVFGSMILEVGCRD